MARAAAPPPLHRLPGLALLCLAVAVCFSGGENAAAAAWTRKIVGVHELRVGDFSVKVTNWGATLMSVILPDSKGR
jgi:aldose 1-epimerase